jgi:hypothetical protein
MARGPSRRVSRGLELDRRSAISGRGGVMAGWPSAMAGNMNADWSGFSRPTRTGPM